MENVVAFRGPQPRPKGVLVADDEPGIRNVLDMALRRVGFTVWLAVDGRHAVDVFRRDHEAIGVALLDVDMPRMSGPEALAALQEIAPQIPCCFMSGGVPGYTAEELRRRGGRAFVEKPFQLSTVVGVLHSLIDVAPGPVALPLIVRSGRIQTPAARVDALNNEDFGIAGRSGNGNSRDARGP